MTLGSVCLILGATILFARAVDLAGQLLGVAGVACCCALLVAGLWLARAPLAAWLH